MSIRKNGFAPDTCSFLFLSFSESGQTEKGNGTGINLTGKAFCPGNTPKRDLLNKKREKYPDLNIIYEFISRALGSLKDADLRDNTKDKEFYKEYLSALEYEFRDSLNIFSKLNKFYKSLPQSKDDLIAYEDAISYDIERLVDLITIKPSDYEKLKDSENRLSIGHYTSLDILGFLIDEDVEGID